MRIHRIAATVLCLTASPIPTAALELHAVVLEDCPLGGGSKSEIALEAVGIALAVNLAGRAAEAVADRIAGRLKETKSFSRTRSFPMEGIFQGIDDGKATGLNFALHKKCLVVTLADGIERPIKGDIPQSVLLDKFPMLASVAGGTKEALYRHVGLRSDPAFYAEFLILADAAQSSAFKLDPQFIHYPSWVEKGGKSKDVSLLLEWSVPGQAAPFASASIVRTNMLPLALEKRRLVSEWSTGWSPLPAMPDLTGQEIEVAARYQPVNLKVMFVETSKPNMLAQLLGKTLEDSKSDLTQLSRDTVRQALDAAARAEAQAARAATYSSANKKYADSYLALVDLKSKFDNERSAEVRASLKAQFTAQLLVVKADGEVAKQAAKSIGEQGAFVPLPLPSLP